MPQIIPLTSDPDRTFDVELGGNLLTLRTYYNPTVPGWYMDVEGVAKGLALVPFADVFQSSPELQRTIGQMRLIVSDGADVVAEAIQSQPDVMDGYRVWDQAYEPSGARAGDYWTGALIVNRVSNPSFEIDTDGNGLADGFSPYNNSSVAVTPSLVTGRDGIGAAQQFDFDATSTTSGVQIAVLGNNPGWVPGVSYGISFDCRAGGTHVGKQCLLYWNTPPASVQTINGPLLSSEWARYSFNVTWGPSVEADGRLFISSQFGVSKAGPIVFDNLTVTANYAIGSYVERIGRTFILTESGWVAATIPSLSFDQRATLGSSAQLWWFAPGEWVSDEEAPTLDPVPGAGGYVVA